MKIKFKIILFIVSFVLCKSFVFCENTLFKSKSSTYRDSDKYFDYMIAEYELARGDMKKSFDAFKRLEKVGDTDWVVKSFLRFLTKSGRHDLIIKFEDKFKDDPEIQFIFFQSRMALGHQDQAENLLKALLEKKPDNIKAAYYYSTLLIGENRFDDAIKFIDKFLESIGRDPNHYVLFFLKAKIFFEQKQYEESLKSIDECLRLNYSFLNGWRLKALIAHKLGKVEDFIQGCNRLFDLGLQDLVLQQRVVEILFEQNRFKEAEETLVKMPQNTFEYFYNLALIQWKASKYKEALQNTENALVDNPSSQNSRTLKVEILFNMGKIDELIKFIEDWLATSPNNKAAIDILLALKDKGATGEQIISSLSKIVQKVNNGKSIWAVLGDLYFKDKNLKDALYCYEKVLDLTRDELTRSKVFYQIAHVYSAMGKKNKVEECLLKSVECIEVFPPALNFLAFYYFKEGKEIKKATVLIDKALEQDPENPIFLDTKACLSKFVGKIIQPKKLFERAMQLQPNDFIIKQNYERLCG